jgi:hypothetical protein
MAHVWILQKRGVAGQFGAQVCELRAKFCRNSRSWTRHKIVEHHTIHTAASGKSPLTVAGYVNGVLPPRQISGRGYDLLKNTGCLMNSLWGVYLR